MLIDELAPRADGRLSHSVDIPASVAEVRAAQERVRLSDLRLLGSMVRVRSLGRRLPDSPEPIFAGMRHADYVHVEARENDHGDELAAAMVGPLWDLRNPFRPLSGRGEVLHPDPRWAVTVSSYRIEPTDGGCRFVVETRVVDPSDAAGRRTFRRYWPTVGRLGATVYARELTVAVRRLAVNTPMAQQDGDRSGANRALVCEMLEAGMGRGDVDAAMAAYAGDVSYHAPVIDLSEPGRRPTEVIGDAIRMTRAAFPDLVYRLGAVVAEGDLVAVRYSWTGTNDGSLAGLAPTGRRVTTSGAVFCRVIDGRIVEQWDIDDRLDVMSQLGLVPSPPS